MAINIPYHGQTHFKSSLCSVPESTRYTPWSAPASTNTSPVAPSSSRFLLPASLPERADAMLSTSLLEQCRSESSSRETSPRSSLNSHHPCGSWTSRGGLQWKPPKPTSVIPVPCSVESLKEGHLWGRLSKPEGGSPARSPDVSVSALSAALSGASISAGQVSLDHAVDAAEWRRMGNRLAQRSYRQKIKRRLAELEKKAEISTIAEFEAAKKGNSEHSGSLPMTMPPTRYPARRASSSSETTFLDSSASSSLTTASCDSHLPGILSREDQKKLLLDRLMIQFFKLLASTCRQHAGAASSSSNNTSPTASTSSSLNERSAILRTRGPAAALGRRAGKRSADRGADGDSDEEENGRRRSKAKRLKTEGTETRRLACPFFKRNPHQFKEERSCVGPGWVTVHRVKEHIYRCHTRPFRCLRCHDNFPSEELLHAHSQATTPCELRPGGHGGQFSNAFEGIGLSQERKLRSRKRLDKTEEEKWVDVYRICFPDDTNIPNPYFEIPASADISGEGPSSEFTRCEEFMRRELPGRVRNELEVRIERALVPMEENLKQQLVGIVQELQVRLFEEFKQAYRQESPMRANASEVAASGASANIPDGPSQMEYSPFAQDDDGNGKDLMVSHPDDHTEGNAGMESARSVSQPMGIALPLYPFIMDDWAAVLNDGTHEDGHWESQWMNAAYSSWM